MSDIIINKNLKLLLINYLAQKVDALFHFPSRSQYTWERTYGRTVYLQLVYCASHTTPNPSPFSTTDLLTNFSLTAPYTPTLQSSKYKIIL